MAAKNVYDFPTNTSSSFYAATSQVSPPPAVMYETRVHRMTPYESGRTYIMRAWSTALSQYVYWTCSGVVDTLGATSGYTPSTLTDIVMLR